jgi:hypothetical protein
VTTLPPVVAAAPSTPPAVPSATLHRAELGAAVLRMLLDMPVVSATVVARTPQGATVISTPRGEVTIPEGPDLLLGTEVAVRIVGQSPLTISLRAQPRPEATPPPAAASPTVLVEKGPVIEATLVRANDASLPPGARIPIRILGVETPPPAVATQADQPRTRATAAGEVASPTIPSPKPGVPADATADAAPPSLPDEVDASSPATRPTPARDSVRPASALPTRSAAFETARLSTETGGIATDPEAVDARRPLPVSISASAEEQVARVIHQTPGAVVLRAPFGLLSIQGLKASEEALVRFVFAAPTVEPRERTRSPVRHAWSALGEALRILETAAPGAAERFAADLQPRNPENLAANVRLLAAAQREGAPPPLAAEIGEALTVSGHAVLADELRSEFAAPRLPPSASASDGWQVVAFPIHDGTSLRPAQLYVEEEAARRRRTADAPSRFILEVGALQFDGLLRPRRFDLLLRSRTPLRDDMRSEIERIFRGTVDACGWTGGIAFSTIPAFPAAAEQLRVSA